MKFVCNHRITKYFISFILILAMVLGMVLKAGLRDSANTAEASTQQTDKLNVEKLWETKRDKLGWCDSSNKPLPAMWEDTSKLDTVWLSVSPDALAYAEVFEVIATDTDAANADVPNTDVSTSDVPYAYAEGVSTAQAYEQLSGAVGRRIELVGDVSNYTYTDEEKSVASCAFSGIESYEINTSENKELYDKLLSGDTEAWGNITRTAAEGSGVNVRRFKYQDFTYKVSLVNKTSDELYYTIEYDSALNGYYRKYYVSTADQLALLLQEYQNNATSVIAQASETDNGKTGVRKLGIKLLCDIDLGGASDKKWWGFRQTTVSLELDGNGYTLYNGYFDNSVVGRLKYYTESSNRPELVGTVATVASEYGYFLNGDSRFAIYDMNFSNMFIPHSNGMFGLSAAMAFLENVDFEDCFAIANTTGAAIVFGNSYNRCYVKDCMISNSYINGVKGGGHHGLFASYNGGQAACNYAYSGNSYQYSYIGDDTESFAGYYYMGIPELSEIERLWQIPEPTSANALFVTADGQTYKLSYFYPSIYENCATINSEVYDASGEHSGTFVSCMQGNLIFKNCFSNCTIYGRSKAGVFMGCAIGSGDGFHYDVNGKKTLVNAYFENCYTSGAIEASDNIGGFIGSIFNDARSVQSSKRGQVVFNNCYSTSSVGMQYSGNNVGGFCGNVYGNVCAEQDDNKAHIFINCYAAGEVGGILTDTDLSANNTIGGFFGGYQKGSGGSTYQDKEYNEATYPKLTNCYYDKQTTAMRERDIGGKELCHTLEGLTGVYTTESFDKGVEGLTDTDSIMTNEGWTYRDKYYPQLTSFTSKPSEVDSNDSVAVMRYNRQMIYYYYSMASTATVFLDHYDEILDESGKLKVADSEIYDTVRDITRKFDFTSDSEIRNWQTDEVYNDRYNFHSTLGGDERGFSIDYTPERDYIKDTSGYTREYNPQVLTIANVDDVWKCLDFAPGKQWVSVTTGTGSVTGRRYLRLLPTAYLNAGNIMNINVSEVTENDNTIITNEVTVNSDSRNADGSIVTIPLTRFNHSVGVSYAITDKYRMGYSNIYSAQTITGYSATAVNDNTSFAFYKTYPLAPDADNNQLCVGLNDAGKMFSQEFTNNMYDNNSTDGMTMVRVYKTNPVHVNPDDDTSPFTLERGTEITDSEALKKWQGEKLFETTDKGYYYMVYYWRLDDGRYLEDTKLVRVSNNEYSVEIIAGILGEEHKVTDAMPASTAIDMYVTADVDNQNKPYPSADASFSKATVAGMYDIYNGDLEHNEDIYKIKSNKIVTGSHTTEVGWYRSPEFKITTLIVEAQDSSGTWHEMTRLEDPEHTDKFDFEDAKYQYQYTTYSVSQDSVTKLFNIEQNPTRDVIFKVENSSTDLTGIQKNILFSFAASGDDVGGSDFSDVNDNLRITVLFRRNEADIKADKTVLMGETVIDGTDGSITSDKSFDEEESYREVDNTGIDIAQNRKAVISGDILTYRMKLHNTGYIDSSTVNVYDVVPEGCTYIPNSMKIYCQAADFSSSAVKYGGINDVTSQAGYSVRSTTVTSGENQGRERLVWTIPKIELDHNYYVEYQVKVDDIAATDEKRLLTNTATWDFISLNGDTDDNSDNISVEAYKQHAIFDMDVDVLKSDNEIEDRTYCIYFEQVDSDAYSDISFTNYFPTGFTYSIDKGIRLYKKTGTDANGEEIYQEVVLGAGENDVKLSMDSTNTYFEMKNLNLSQGDKYKVEFSGTQKALGLGDNNVDEIRNKSIIIYTKDGIDSHMGNSIIKTERLTNTVETDVTWLYLNIEKNIGINDTEQSFLMQIAYYENEADTEPADVFYTRINCTEAIPDVDGSSVTGYRGNQIIQCGKRGKYVVTEVTDWSATDYDFDKSAANDMSLTDGAGNQIYPSDVKINSRKIGNKDNSVTIELPRVLYESGAFPTSLGTDMTRMPSAVFYNNESPYAYLSGQSYSENNFVIK